MQTKELKKLYIPHCVKGDISISQAAYLIGCTRQTVINLKKRFRALGEKAFIHGSKGRPSCKAVKPGIKKKIVDFYRQKWQDSPFFCSSSGSFAKLEKKKRRVKRRLYFQHKRKEKIEA